jgi:3-oxoacyl-[acyl-carrier-protein] synthase-3
MIRGRISGVGYSVPPRVVKNDDLKEMMDTSDEWIRTRTGIEERRWVEGSTTTSDLAFEASVNAIRMANIDPKSIDMIVFATLSPDHDFPGTGCFLQKKLGLPGIPALDIRQQCTGFIYGLSIADQFIRTGMYKTILVVGAEIHSKGLDLSTEGREVSVLFGDGAGAAILQACEYKDPINDPGILSTHLHADGSFAEELWVPAPGMAYFPTRFSYNKKEKLDYPKMNGKTVFTHAVKKIPETIEESLKQNGLTIDDVDLFVLHQANLRINEMVANRMGIPSRKVFNTIQKFANTTAATIPIGLSVAVEAGKLKPGMLVSSAAFGSGFTWGSALIRW